MPVAALSVFRPSQGCRGREPAPLKRLICCLDGTWNRPDQDGNPTNVTELMRAIRPTDAAGNPQVVFYDKGVGTGGPVDRLLGGMFGKGLDEQIRGAYRFLVHNYAPGDEIYLFGFSRGAFSARSLGGMIGEMGLLADERTVTTQAVWRAYQRPRGERGRPAALAGIRRHARVDVRIRALGVWDTVGALGIPYSLLTWRLRRRHRFHDVGLGDHIDRSFHALAIDERRGPFSPTLWRGDARSGHALADAGATVGPIVEQCWFAGVHSDVGGGYERNGLSRLSLAWMIQRIGRTTGLAFRAAYGTLNTKQDALAPQNESRGWQYLMSYLLPCLRAITGRLPAIGWRETLRARARLARTSGTAINEVVHRAALDRRGRRVTVVRFGGRLETVHYRPPNLAIALGHLPVIEHDGSISRPDNGLPNAPTRPDAVEAADAATTG